MKSHDLSRRRDPIISLMITMGYLWGHAIMRSRRRDPMQHIVFIMNFYEVNEVSIEYLT
jgi:hypothetical protein